MARTRGLEPRTAVLETAVFPLKLNPYVRGGAFAPSPVVRFCYAFISPIFDATTGTASMLMDTTMSIEPSAVSLGDIVIVMGLPSSTPIATGL